MQTLLTRVVNGYTLQPPYRGQHYEADTEEIFVFGTFKELSDHLEKLMPLEKEKENE